MSNGDLSLGFDIGAMQLSEPEIVISEQSEAELVTVTLSSDDGQWSTYSIHPSMVPTLKHVLDGMCEAQPIGHVTYQGKWVQG